MNDFIGNHTPTPEFRASLEREIVSTYRRETQFAPPVRLSHAGRLRTAVALAAGLVIGVAMAFTSTHVAEARQRDEIASTTGAKRELAAVQLGLARANFDQVRRAFDQGAITQASRLSAEAELHASEAKVARIELDLAESRTSAAPPRDELWAPLVGDRDFVKERLLIDSAAADRRMTAVTAAAADAERAFTAGVLTRPAVAEAQSDVMQAKRDVDAVARKLSLRKQFLEQHLAPEDVARRLQRFELMTDVERAEQLLRLAEERLTIARERSGLGAAREVKVKKAQVAALEHSLELEQLRLVSARTVLTYTAPVPAPVQQGIPLVDLPTPSAKTTESLGSLLGIREVAGGQLLVNDAGNRQLKLFDSTLATSTVALDSTPGVVNRYGARVALVRFRGDSSVLPDILFRTFRVLDSRGQVARTVSWPNAQLDFSAAAYSDDRGRLLYSGLVDWSVGSRASDSTPILRVDLESRRVDTVGRAKARNGLGLVANWFGRDSGSSAFTQLFTFRDGTPTLRYPSAGLVPTRDDWAVLSDGSIAVVRGHDYHIDWIRSNGTMSSTSPLPFDRSALTNDNKRGFGDSSFAGQIVAGGARGRGGARGAAGVLDSTRVKLNGLVQRFLVADVLASFPTPSFGAAIPDLDGNVWILPTAPARPQNAQLVYDVVNSTGQLFARVRMPVGRSVAGFGKGGAVYLVSRDPTNGLFLERTTIVGSVIARPR